jgi:hypothetical protein
MGRCGRAQRGGVVVAIVATIVGGCAAKDASSSLDAGSAARPVGSAATLGGDVVARVGSVDVTKALVRDVARARGLDARAAVTVLVDEALLAEASSRALATSSEGERAHAAARRDATLTRRLLRVLHDEAASQGAATADEYARVMGSDWFELDCPESRASIHALLLKKTADLDAECAKLAAALATTKDDDAFLATAKAFTLPDGTHPVVEPIGEIIATGRAVSRDPNGVVEPFARAVFALPAVGAVSGPTTTDFGCHVIRLTRIVPPVHASDAVLAERLGGRVVRERAVPGYTQLLDTLRAAAHAGLPADTSPLAIPRFLTRAPGVVEVGAPAGTAP